MSDPFTITAGVVGIVVPALHGARLLIDDLKKITDAPRVVTSLETDLTSVSSSLESLKAINEPQWQVLGSRIVDQSKAAVKTCTTACDAMRGDLQRWTRRSRDGKLSWRDKANIGFFKERRVKAMSEQLQSCKQTLSSVVGVATLYVIDSATHQTRYLKPSNHFCSYSSLRNTAMTEEIKRELAARQADMTMIVETTDTRLASAGQSLAELRLTNAEEQSEQDEDDAVTALSAVEAELATLQGLQETMRELLSTLEAEKVEQAAVRPQPGSVHAVFGAYNSGFQLGSNSGPISGMTIGQPQGGQGH
jgi:hypothetical protein